MIRRWHCHPEERFVRRRISTALSCLDLASCNRRSLKPCTRYPSPFTVLSCLAFAHPSPHRLLAPATALPFSFAYRALAAPAVTGLYPHSPARFIASTASLAVSSGVVVELRTAPPAANAIEIAAADTLSLNSVITTTSCSPNAK